jgi:16S rRNA (cytidine1402-2'-O)-methyltransferase
MCSALPGTVCFFEAPHRITRTLTEGAKYFGNRPIVVGRELTKVHQEFLRGTAHELADRCGDPRGEFTVIVGPAENAPETTRSPVSDEQLADEFGHTTETMGLGRRQAITTLARKYGRPARDVYAAIERGRK